MMTNNTAIILGNGTSRKSLDIEAFRKDGPFFGCNAIWRDTKVDYLLAIDPLMIQEIVNSFRNAPLIVPPAEEQFEPLEYAPYGRRENTGMLAMKEAIRQGFTHLKCFGFDFLIADESLNMSNIYDGTACYGAETRASPEDCINRCLYLEWFMQKHSNVKFSFHFPSKKYVFRRLASPNFHLTLVEM